jgi:hypothetical protein
MNDRFCLNIAIVPDGSRLRYKQSYSGSIMDMVSLPISRSAQLTLWRTSDDRQNLLVSTLTSG